MTRTAQEVVGGEGAAEQGFVVDVLASDQVGEAREGLGDRDVVDGPRRFEDDSGIGIVEEASDCRIGSTAGHQQGCPAQPRRGIPGEPIELLSRDDARERRDGGVAEEGILLGVAFHEGGECGQRVVIQATEGAGGEEADPRRRVVEERRDRTCGLRASEIPDDLRGLGPDLRLRIVQQAGDDLSEPGLPPAGEVQRPRDPAGARRARAPRGRLPRGG